MSTVQRCTNLVERFNLIDNLKKSWRPICGSLALQKLNFIENLDLVEYVAVTNFSTKSVLHALYLYFT